MAALREIGREALRPPVRLEPGLDVDVRDRADLYDDAGSLTQVG